jgi:hypothetical protein
MKKIMFLVALATGIATTTVAQDVITKRDGSEIKATVIKVSRDEVEYKKFNSPSGPTYSMPKSEIFMIKYADGTKDVFQETAAPQQSYGQPNQGYNPNFNPKSPGLAWFLSFLVPGVGQFYNGQPGKGVRFLVINVASAGLGYAFATEAVDEDMLLAAGLCYIAYFGNWIWAQIDAPVSAGRLNRQNGYFSWQVGEKSVLSLQPDVKLNHLGNFQPTPSYGMSLKVNF